ncbi:MAG: lipid A biosynthesis acyltransferase [Candidatus Pelagibacter sp. TMED64]|nr:lipid A biosynthesis acyltransferase [Candidatus Pelagibacter sp.]OUU64099.1 MAG: lipid A biosynthesis acyltransferase [Candidatus Pelagibacter sp. TMED64]
MKIIRYFFEFLVVVSLLSFFKIIGLKLASICGGLIGKVIGPIFRPKSIIQKNLNIAFNNNLSANQEKTIIENMWINYGKILGEYIHLKKFRKSLGNNSYVKIIGSRYLQEIKESKKPVVFFSGHFSNFELMAMELDKFNINLAALYRPLNNIFLNPLMEYLRIKYICANQIPKGRSGTREILKKFKNGHSIALMVDQSVTEGEKVLFFNKLASTTTIPAQIARKFGCKIVPIFFERISQLNFEMTIQAPFDANKTENYQNDIKSTTHKVNLILEEMIKKNPNQWIWSHNRWK